MSSQPIESATDDVAEVPRKSLLRKLIGWSVALALVLVAANWIAGLRSDQKGKFVKTTYALAEGRCSGDAACLTSLKAKFEVCLSEHSDSHKSGKYGRKYTLDEAAFLGCVR